MGVYDTCLYHILIFSPMEKLIKVDEVLPVLVMKTAVFSYNFSV